MFEGEFESLRAIYETSPAFAPKPLAWGSYQDEQGSETFFLLEEFRHIGDQVGGICQILSYAGKHPADDRKACRPHQAHKGARRSPPPIPVTQRQIRVPRQDLPRNHRAACGRVDRLLGHTLWSAPQPLHRPCQAGSAVARIRYPVPTHAR